jgi:hypothetical protein
VQAPGDAAVLSGMGLTTDCPDQPAVQHQPYECVPRDGVENTVTQTATVIQNKQFINLPQGR